MADNGDAMRALERLAALQDDDEELSRARPRPIQDDLIEEEPIMFLTRDPFLAKLYPFLYILDQDFEGM